MLTPSRALLRYLPFAGGYPCCCGDEGGGSSGGSSSSSSGSSSTSGAPVGTIDCTFCSGGVVAEYYQVEISGLAEHTDCADCAALDGAYIIGPMQQVFIGGDPANCSDAILTATVCAESEAPDCYGLLGLQFYHGAGRYRLLVTLLSGGTPCGQGGGQPMIEWESDLGVSPPDCLVEGVSVPFVSNGIPGAERCDGSGATCTVTAIPAP